MKYVIWWMSVLVHEAFMFLKKHFVWEISINVVLTVTYTCIVSVYDDDLYLQAEIKESRPR